MNSHIISLLVLFSTAIIFAEMAKADINIEQPTSLQDVHDIEEPSESSPVTRDKRTLLLKKKLAIGAIGFGLGAIKGYTFGRYSGNGGYNHGYGGYGGYNGYNTYGYGGGNNYGYSNGYGYGGYGGYRPSYRYSPYVGSNQVYTQTPSYYVARPTYYSNGNTGRGWSNGYNNYNYANAHANSWSTSGNVGPQHATLNTGSYNSVADNGGYVY